MDDIGWRFVAFMAGFGLAWIINADARWYRTFNKEVGDFWERMYRQSEESRHKLYAALFPPHAPKAKKTKRNQKAETERPGKR